MSCEKAAALEFVAAGFSLIPAAKSAWQSSSETSMVAFTPSSSITVKTNGLQVDGSLTGSRLPVATGSLVFELEAFGPALLAVLPP